MSSSPWSWCVLVVALVAHVALAEFDLLVLHTNDMHARFDQTNQLSSKCSAADVAKSNCYGGFARVAHVVKEARRRARDGVGPPVVFLNAGDTYQGTVWFTVHKWRIVAALSNALHMDAASLGNHEFDDGVSGLVPFINNASFPVLAANLDLSREPTLAATRLAKSVVLQVAGKRVGVIGFLTRETKEISSPGLVDILDEVVSVRKEAEKLRGEGVDILIALGHAGYEVDQEIAAKVPDIDVVVGGHTNTFLYTGTRPDLSDEVHGKYPTIVTQSSGKQVPVVQAYAYTKYVGSLTLKFDDDGEVTSWGGNPILLDKSVPQDADMLREVDKWRGDVQNLTGSHLGSSRVFLNGDQRSCRIAECNMGNLITDSLIDYYVARNKLISGWTDAPIALFNGGGIRGSIDTSQEGGVLTTADLLGVLPFDNSISMLRLKGEHLAEALEWSVANYNVNNRSASGTFLQVSGLRVVYDVCRKSRSRVVSVTVRCGRCAEPVYKPLNATQVYGVLMPSYIADGGDGFEFHKHAVSQTILDITDSGALGEYITKLSPIYPETEGRVTLIDVNRCVAGAKRIDDAVKSSGFMTATNYLLLALLTALSSVVPHVT